MRKLALAVLLLTLPLAAAPIYVGTFGGNDSEAAVEAILGLDITLYDKSDEAPDLTAFTPSAPGGALSGTWDVNDDTVLISYLTVKASTYFAIYEYNPAVNSGNWSTADIVNPGAQQPGLSHLSLWIGPSQPVPEPGTWALIAAGLIGVGLIRRRRVS